MTIIGCHTTYARTGAGFRQRTPGPEDDLVERFLEHQPFRLERGCRLTIFREPCLESGFPDLVAVVWRPSATKKWNPLRASITLHDIRLMQFLYRQGPCASAYLKAVFSTRVRASLERLAAAGMVRSKGEMWLSRPLKECFAVKRIVAVEAKIADWQTALKQATLNTWFASASYVLLPRIPKSDKLTSSALKLGIGVWAHGDSLIEHSPTQPEQLPRSYASWMFNEWVWRASELCGDGAG